MECLYLTEGGCLRSLTGAKEVNRSWEDALGLRPVSILT